MRKYIVLATIVGVTVAGIPALAEEGGSSSNTGAKKAEIRVEKKMEKSEMRMEKLETRLERLDFPAADGRGEGPALFGIGPDGMVRINRANVTAVGTNSLTVNIWGLSVVVDTTNAKFSPAVASSTTVQVNDKVNVRGKMQTNGTVAAAMVHDLNWYSAATDQLRDRIKKLIEQLRELQAKAGVPQTPLP